MPQDQSLSVNLKAFLDMLAWSEGTSTIPTSDNGYNVLVGSTPAHPILFASYADHPRVLNHALHSTAAGRYQLLAHWYDAYKAYLHLTDFSPASQDAIAVQQVRERKALPLIEDGAVTTAITQCSNIWASLPGNNYGQHANTYSDLVTKFLEFGGWLA